MGLEENRKINKRGEVYLAPERNSFRADFGEFLEVMELIMQFSRTWKVLENGDGKVFGFLFGEILEIY